jgi:hypothetical protein
MGFGMGIVGLSCMCVCITRARQKIGTRILGYGMGILTAENDEHVGVAYLGWGRFALTVLEREVGHLSKSNAIREQRTPIEGSDGLRRQTNILGGWYVV